MPTVLITGCSTGIGRATAARLSAGDWTVIATARRVEAHYGSSQDIEWAIDEAGELFLLQSRPETVWAEKDAAAAPVATPAARPFDHVFSALGGGKRGS